MGPGFVKFLGPYEPVKRANEPENRGGTNPGILGVLRMAIVCFFGDSMAASRFPGFGESFSARTGWIRVVIFFVILPPGTILSNEFGAGGKYVGRGVWNELVTGSKMLGTVVTG